jgi:hypothetical protein
MTSESIKRFRKIPKRLRATLTVDNGKEFSQFKEIEIKTGLTVCFADCGRIASRGNHTSYAIHVDSSLPSYPRYGALLVASPFKVIALAAFGGLF